MFLDSKNVFLTIFYGFTQKIEKFKQITKIIFNKIYKTSKKSDIMPNQKQNFDKLIHDL